MSYNFDPHNRNLIWENDRDRRRNRQLIDEECATRHVHAVNMGMFFESPDKQVLKNKDQLTQNTFFFALEPDYEENAQNAPRTPVTEPRNAPPTPVTELRNAPRTPVTEPRRHYHVIQVNDMLGVELPDVDEFGETEDEGTEVEADRGIENQDNETAGTGEGTQ